LRRPYSRFPESLTMFLPKAAISSASSLRNPRRRQRTSSDEPVNPPKAKRQRSSLRHGSSDICLEDQSELREHGNCSTTLASQDLDTADNATFQESMPIRGPKKLERRGEADGTIVLSKTDFYNVLQLPALPDQIRGLQSGKEPNGPLPLGILLSTVTAGIPGLMIVAPDTGNITYWETVSCAASLGLARQKQKTFQGCIPNLLSGEHITDLVNGEPSGIIVTLSSGRVAHITVRDPQGKPTVTVNSCEIRPGLRDIIIATSGGLFEIWDTHWNNGSILKKQFDIIDDLCRHLGTEDSNRSDDSNIKILDFSLMPAECNVRELPGSVSVASWHLSLIVTQSGMGSQSMSLVQVNLAEEVHILSSHPIDLHGVSAGLDSKPKLYLPKPGDMAFVLVDYSVILLSLSSTEHQSAQPQQQRVFQDSISFRSGKAFEILGSGFEDKNNENSCPACLIMVRDFGTIRITALPHYDSCSTAECVRITAKQKIEQAIFYGTMLGNPLNLNNKSSLDFSVADIEQAALDICRELLQSTSKFIPATAISLEQNLRSRAKALDDLAYLLVQQNKALSQQTWWELLWGAEKLAAQRAMWKIEESSRKLKGKGPTFLAHVINSMSDKFKTRVEKQDGEVDPVRNWFLHDTFQMEHVVPWIFNAIKPKKGHSSRQGRKMSEQILEASELSLAVLETAFRYRDEHASRYGIRDGYLEDGVLVTGFKDLPEFWTSQNFSYVETGHLLDLELDSQMHCERVRWLSAQEDPKLVDEGIATEHAHVKQRKWRLFKLAGIGRLEDAITLAEKFRDMSALVELIIELQDQTKGEILPQNSRNDASDSINCWINDVIGEIDYSAAAQSLEKLAIGVESDLWSHRVELSLAKLAKLATWEETNISSHSGFHNDIRHLEDLSEIDAVQELIYACISPALQGAIDQRAEADLAIDHFGKRIAEDRPSLHELLSETLTKVVTRQIIDIYELVDILTLMDSDQASEYSQSELSGKEFYLALRVIRLGTYAQQGSLNPITMQKLVWRRCMIKDNWVATGRAAESMDNESEPFIYDTALFRTLGLCLKDRYNEDASYASLYIPSSPHDVFLNGSDSEVLSARFRPEQRTRIMHDLERENEMLHQYVGKGRLDFWFKNLRASAEESASTPIHPTFTLEESNHNNQQEERSPQQREGSSKARLNWL
ncbi:hypothetical protein ANOM_010078, partial [Aspergillus nomiae NRRL 13137]